MHVLPKIFSQTDPAPLSLRKLFIINAMDVRERLQSAPTLSNTLKHLIPNAWIAKNGLLTINAMAVRERL